MNKTSKFLLGGVATIAALLAQDMNIEAAASSGTMKWGAVGHDDRAAMGAADPYNTVTLPQQMDLLVNAKLGWFRTGCTDVNCNLVASVAKQHGISILRSIESRPNDKMDETGNYNLAYNYALDQGRRYHGVFVYYEASNELDVWVGVKGDGSHPSDYDQGRYALARGFLRGLIEGLKAGDASALVLVDDSGWCHYGFLQSLWKDGLRWDITAIHWYAGQGNIEQVGCNNANVLQIHQGFGRPIWITEFNSDNAAKSNDTAGAGTWIEAFMSQVKTKSAQYDIEAAFVYELLDEPNNPQVMEQHFGIADSSGKAKSQYQSIIRGVGVSNPSPPTQLKAS